jgi:integrase
MRTPLLLTAAATSERNRLVGHPIVHFERFENWKDLFTPHDLRRSMATQLAERGVQPHIIEKMLNHRMEGVWAVYNRYEYLPERQAAWRMWGATLAGLRRKLRRGSHARSADGF